MARSHLITGMALALVGGAGVLWWSSATGLDEGVTGALEGGTGALTPGGVRPERARLETVDAPATEQGEERAAVADVIGDEAVSQLGVGKGKAYGVPTDAVWATGRVQLPEGTPADERLVVVANGRKFETRKGEPEEYVAEVEPDGSFKVAFAKKTRRGKLTIEGRYVYLENPYVFNPHAPEEEVVLTPALGGRVEVEVLPPAMQSFDEGVLDELVVEALAGRWSQHPKLDGVQIGEGRFELGGAKPNVGYDVYAKSPVFADGQLENVRVEPGETAHVQVALTFGARLFGDVLDQDGKLVKHAKVLALSKQEAAERNPFINRTVDTVSEEGDGTYDIRGVRPGDLVLVVEADGFLEKRHEVGELFDGEERSARLTLDRGGVIRGVVQWPGGDPAIGAEVRLTQESTFGGGGMGGGLDFEQQMGRIEVGASGEFVFSALKSGTCSVTASAVERGFELPPDASLRERKFGTRPMWRAHKDGVKPGAVLTLELTPGSNVVGVVVDDAGEPIRNFQITATPDGTDMLNARSIKPIRERFKSPEGEFDLGGVQDGRWRMSARALGFATCKEVVITAPYDGELKLTLPRSGRISGVVLAPTGKPVEKARVRVRHGDGRDATAETDRKGEFNVSRIEPGALVITATAAGWASALPLELAMSADGSREGLTLSLRTGGALLCDVHEAAGPRADREVSLRGQGRNNGRTDRNGRVEFKGLEPGTYTVELAAVQVEGGDRRSNWMRSFTNKKSVEVEVRDGEAQRVVLGQPSPNAVTVRGRVLDDGQPVAEANVAVFADGQDDAAGGDVTEADGTYEILLDGPGEYRFVVGRDWGSQSTFMRDVPAGATHALDFELPGGALTGFVRGGGKPVEGASLTLTPVVNGAEQGAGRWFGRRQTGSQIDGRFTFEDVADGTYNLRVQANERLEGGARLSSVLVENVTVKDGEEQAPLEVELPLAGWVEGTVVDSAGASVSRASIQVTTEAGAEITQFSRTRSANDGRFEYQGIAPGTVLVTATRDGHTSPAERVRVQSGAGSQVRLVLPD
jgi:uncharacterized GH25 family protein